MSCPKMLNDCTGMSGSDCPKRKPECTPKGLVSSPNGEFITKLSAIRRELKIVLNDVKDEEIARCFEVIMSNLDLVSKRLSV